MKDYERIASLMRLYAVTDRGCIGDRDFLDVLEKVLKGGVSLLQLREKDLSDDEFIKEAFRVKELCCRYSVLLIINDNVNVAKVVGADGVHIGQGDMDLHLARDILGDEAIIGVSVHNLEQALAAQSGGADYLGLGAAFSTDTKSDVDVMSADMMRSITSAVHIPTCAIGGINRRTISELEGRGVDGVAVVSALFGSEDPSAAARELYSVSQKLFARKKAVK